MSFATTSGDPSPLRAGDSSPHRPSRPVSSPCIAWGSYLPSHLPPKQPCVGFWDTAHWRASFRASSGFSPVESPHLGLGIRSIGRAASSGCLFFGSTRRPWDIATTSWACLVALSVWCLWTSTIDEPAPVCLGAPHSDLGGILPLAIVDVGETNGRFSTQML